MNVDIAKGIKPNPRRTNLTMWSIDSSNPDSPAAAEIGNLCLWVSRIDECLYHRWVWTGDVQNEQGDGIRSRPPIHDVADSREQAMADAEKAARRWLSSKPEANE